MARNSKVETLVVGAGPVGLMMALELVHHDVPCRIVDQLPEASKTSKALVLWPRSLEILDTLGLARPALAAGRCMKGVRIGTSQRDILRVDFSNLASPFPQPLMLPQSQTEALMWKALQERGVHVERPVACTGVSLTTDGADAVLRHPDGSEETVSCRFLIGCDGAHSAVRKAMQLPFDGQAVEAAFAMGDVRLVGDAPRDEVSLFWTPGGFAGLFPLDPPVYRVLVNAGLDEDNDELTVEHLESYLHRRGLTQFRLSEPTWLARFHIHQRMVSSYRCGAVLLAGDAAHIHSPAGGQGMNTGLQDAHNLGWKLGQIRRHPEPALAARLLDSYDAERRPVGAEVLRASGLATMVSTLTHPVQQALRNAMVGTVGRLPAMQRRAAGLMSELSVHYRHSPLNRSNLAFPGRVRAGDRAPDGHLTPGLRLFEAFQRRPFTLLALTGPRPLPSAWSKALATAACDELQVVVVSPGASPASPLETYADADGKLHVAYGLDSGGLLMVRPDGYVGVTARLDGSPPVLGEWLRLYGLATDFSA